MPSSFGVLLSLLLIVSQNSGGDTSNDGENKVGHSHIPKLKLQDADTNIPDQWIHFLRSILTKDVIKSNISTNESLSQGSFLHTGRTTISADNRDQVIPTTDVPFTKLTDVEQRSTPETVAKTDTLQEVILSNLVSGSSVLHETQPKNDVNGLKNSLQSSTLPHQSIKNFNSRLEQRYEQTNNTTDVTQSRGVKQNNSKTNDYKGSASFITKDVIKSNISKNESLSQKGFLHTGQTTISADNRDQIEPTTDVSFIELTDVEQRSTPKTVAKTDTLPEVILSNLISGSTVSHESQPKNDVNGMKNSLQSSTLPNQSIKNFNSRLKQRNEQTNKTTDVTQSKGVKQNNSIANNYKRSALSEVFEIIKLFGNTKTERNSNPSREFQQLSDNKSNSLSLNSLNIVPNTSDVQKEEFEENIKYGSDLIALHPTYLPHSKAVTRTMNDSFIIYKNSSSLHGTNQQQEVFGGGDGNPIVYLQYEIVPAALENEDVLGYSMVQDILDNQNITQFHSTQHKNSLINKSDNFGISKVRVNHKEKEVIETPPVSDLLHQTSAFYSNFKTVSSPNRGLESNNTFHNLMEIMHEISEQIKNFDPDNEEAKLTRNERSNQETSFVTKTDSTSEELDYRSAIPEFKPQSKDLLHSLKGLTDIKKNLFLRNSGSAVTEKDSLRRRLFMTIPSIHSEAESKQKYVDIENPTLKISDMNSSAKQSNNTAETILPHLLTGNIFGKIWGKVKSGAENTSKYASNVTNTSLDKIKSSLKDVFRTLTSNSENKEENYDEDYINERGSTREVRPKPFKYKLNKTKRNIVLLGLPYPLPKSNHKREAETEGKMLKTPEQTSVSFNKVLCKYSTEPIIDYNILNKTKNATSKFISKIKNIFRGRRTIPKNEINLAVQRNHYEKRTYQGDKNYFDIIPKFESIIQELKEQVVLLRSICKIPDEKCAAVLKIDHVTNKLTHLFNIIRRMERITDKNNSRNLIETKNRRPSGCQSADSNDVYFVREKFCNHTQNSTRLCKQMCRTWNYDGGECFDSGYCCCFGYLKKVRNDKNLLIF